MFRNPCKRGGNIVLSIVSFIFLTTSAAGLSLTIHDSQNIPFLKNNDKELVPFLSVVCGVSSLLFIYTFLDIECKWKCCCIRCYEPEHVFYDNNYQSESLYNDVDTSIHMNTDNQNKKETDPLLYPKLYPELISNNINILKR